MISAQLTLAGALSVLGWDPWGFWPVAVVAYSFLWRGVADSDSTVVAGWRGFAFGVAQHATAHGGMLLSMFSAAGVSMPFSLAGAFGFIVYLALFSAVPCALWFAFFRRAMWRAPVRDALAFASLLTLGEWSRAHGFFDFSFLSLGHAVLDTPLAGYVPLVGCHGASLTAFVLAALICSTRNDRGWRPGVIAAIALIPSFGVATRSVSWVTEAGPPVSFRLLQPNEGPARKVDRVPATVELDRLVGQLVEKEAVLVATPETAIPVFLHEIPGAVIERMRAHSARTGSHFLLGVPRVAAGGAGRNSLIHVDGTQQDAL